MNKKQNGFSVVEALLILVIVGILVGTGWYVWNSKNETDKVLNDTDKTSSTQANTSVNNSLKDNIVKIPELGIQLTTPESLKDMIYVPGDKSNLSNEQKIEAVGFISTKILKEEEPTCTTSEGAPLGTLWKVDGQYVKDDSTWTLVKQFSDFHITYRQPAMNCSSNAEFNDKVAKLLGEVKTSLNGMKAIK
jgi:hypothetical protein